MDITIKLLEKDAEINFALALAEEVFTEFEAPDYPPEGADSFRDFLYGERMREMRAKGEIFFFGAYNGSELAGVSAVRHKSHITLLFVRGKYHRNGIGTVLLDAACARANKLYGTRVFSVNSSSCGLPFYKAAGFISADEEKTEDGIIYTPMIFSYNK